MFELQKVIDFKELGENPPEAVNRYQLIDENGEMYLWQSYYEEEDRLAIVEAERLAEQ